MLLLKYDEANMWYDEVNHSVYEPCEVTMRLRNFASKNYIITLTIHAKFFWE